MPVDPIATPVRDVLGARPAQPGATPAAKDQFGQDTFLKLLVAQLRYQDPTSPADGTQFLAQTAQFTTLEKLSEVAKLETQLLAAQRVLQASSLLGRTVVYPGADGTDVTGVVSGARFAADGPVLKVDGKDVPVAQVTEVRAAST